LKLYKKEMNLGYPKNTKNTIKLEPNSINLFFSLVKSAKRVEQNYINCSSNNTITLFLCSKRNQLKT